MIGNAALRIDPANVESITDALVRVASDDNLRAELRDQGFINAERFDWNDNARLTLDVYANAMGSNVVARLPNKQTDKSLTANFLPGECDLSERMNPFRHPEAGIN